MQFLYSVFVFALFISYNPTICHRYNYTPEELINNHLFFLEPGKNVFSPYAEPISYPDKCELKQLHLNTRHGSRYPEWGDILEYDELEKVFANVTIAKEWYKNPFPMSKQFQLIERGELEAYFDGIQCRKRYAKFWEGLKYDPEVIKFQSSATSRTGMSAMAFSEGVFNGMGSLDTCKSQPVYISSIPSEQDSVLQPYYCTRFNQTVMNIDKNQYLQEQIYPYGNQTIKPIAERLSKEYNITLDPKLVPAIFTYCQFWVTLYNRTDTWCSLLSPEELLRCRYYYDITYYYSLSYGHPFNKRMGCAYYTQLVNEVDSYLNGSSSVRADLKDSHGFTLMLDLTSLGLLKEKFNLTADLPLEKIKNLRSTIYTTIHWSTTLYFEIYVCSGDNNDVKVRALLDFEPLPIPGCDGEYCDWKKFKEILGDQIGCDWDEMCAYP
ncbi:hypothetical protein Glove_374g17 [Diversispora epigaea]|uniref:Multiple inositol polyphosphate phosphatase 1 n=1 Tax=Diversispora epigaea TaxID=1348612 RepID=A0A397H6J1_9GLOM|nr:hypothetical protein Glove_374g17 [Diversispora epigaea]